MITLNTASWWQSYEYFGPFYDTAIRLVDRYGSRWDAVHLEVVEKSPIMVLPERLAEQLELVTQFYD